MNVIVDAVGPGNGNSITYKLKFEIYIPKLSNSYPK